MSSPGVRPHRGTMILVLGILGIVLCIICGIIAWVMGNADLREMEAGTMDRSGEGLTKAGKICGMISVILYVVGFALWLVLVLLAMVAGVAGAASGGGTP
jgi:heme/copper-type cytochrome/quinol oxidase subunit 4